MHKHRHPEREGIGLFPSLRAKAKQIRKNPISSPCGRIEISDFEEGSILGLNVGFVNPTYRSTQNDVKTIVTLRT